MRHCSFLCVFAVSQLFDCLRSLCIVQSHVFGVYFTQVLLKLVIAVVQLPCVLYIVHEQYTNMRVQSIVLRVQYSIHVKHGSEGCSSSSAVQIASLEAARTRQMGEVERRLAEQFSSASNVSQLAHRATLDSMREQFERDKLAALEREREQHRKEIGARADLNIIHVLIFSMLTSNRRKGSGLGRQFHFSPTLRFGQIIFCQYYNIR